MAKPQKTWREEIMKTAGDLTGAAAVFAAGILALNALTVTPPANSEPASSSTTQVNSTIGQLSKDYATQSEGKILFVVSEDYSHFAMGFLSKEMKAANLEMTVLVDSNLQKNFAILYVDGEVFEFSTVENRKYDIFPTAALSEASRIFIGSDRMKSLKTKQTDAVHKIALEASFKRIVFVLGEGYSRRPLLSFRSLLKKRGFLEGRDYQILTGASFPKEAGHMYVAGHPVMWSSGEVFEFNQYDDSTVFTILRRLEKPFSTAPVTLEHN